MPRAILGGPRSENPTQKGCAKLIAPRPRAQTTTQNATGSTRERAPPPQSQPLKCRWVAFEGRKPASQKRCRTPVQQMIKKGKGSSRPGNRIPRRASTALGWPNRRQPSPPAKENQPIGKRHDPERQREWPVRRWQDRQCYCRSASGRCQDAGESGRARTGPWSGGRPCG